MQNAICKTIGIFTLAVLVMSVTGAAATCTSCKAYNDNFNLSPSKNHGNVLANDIGKDIKIVGMSKTTNGGKVTVYCKGDFYYKPASSSRATIHDSFTYTIANKCGQKSTAKVVIITGDTLPKTQQVFRKFQALQELGTLREPRQKMELRKPFIHMKGIHIGLVQMVTSSH